jgi:formiminoglutamase
MNIFEMTTSLDPSLLFRRDDPNDIRMGEVVKTAPEDYNACDFVLLGFPQDEGVRRNKGRLGAKDAPDAIRRCFYKLVEIEGLKLFDLGNTIIQSTLEDSHDWHREIVRQVLRDGKKHIVLGGGNDTSYPDCSALAMETRGDILAFNLDAHFDVRADSPRNSGTPYRQLLEEKHLKGHYFYEMAYQPHANSPIYKQYLEDKKVGLYPLDFEEHNGIATWLKTILERHSYEYLAQAIFWGIDMDVVKAADAPGVSAPNAAGLTAAEFLAIATIAGRQMKSRLFEITEVNPSFDIDERTCRLAAAGIWYFLASSHSMD